VPHEGLKLPLDIYRRIEIWSGARDLNPGPHGPEPAQRCVLPYPGGSLRVLLYSIAELVVSSRVLPCPPGSGIA